MKVKLDNYGDSYDRIKCIAKTEDGEFSFWWSPRVGVIEEAGVSNQQKELSYDEKMEAASRAKIIHRMVYDMSDGWSNRNL